jgi:hypothetical protein
LGPDGLPIAGSKSDVVVKFAVGAEEKQVGLSIKTCFNPKPTNAQLFCSTAVAFCGLLRRNGLAVSPDAERALRMFCGDPGFRPMDQQGGIQGRLSTPERWFWEELPATARAEWEHLLGQRHAEVLTVLLQRAYPNDPYPPGYVMHVQHRALDPRAVPLAIYSIEELVSLSVAYRGFETREYKVAKGRFRGDPNVHLAPRFGIVQFQPLGNTQNRNQLQFNLEANYFNKIGH